MDDLSFLEMARLEQAVKDELAKEVADGKLTKEQALNSFSIRFNNARSDFVFSKQLDAAAEHAKEAKEREDKEEPSNPFITLFYDKKVGANSTDTKTKKAPPVTPAKKRETSEDKGTENAIAHIDYVEVAKNTQQPPAGTSSKIFLDVSPISKGSYNVILPGPFVTFWCQDCGRQLAARSVHDHWAKSHGGDKFNLAGLQNVAAFASQYIANTKSTNKKPKFGGGVIVSSGVGGGIFGVLTSSQKMNPFYQAVSNLPATFAKNITEDQLQELLNNMRDQLSEEQVKIAQNMINHFASQH